MLNAKLINFKPNYIAEILDKADIPYETWTIECAENVEIRIDIGILSVEQQEKIKKISGTDIKNIDYLIFF